MHRRSDRYAPLAPLTHHWFDSTHITYGVVTAGWGNRALQLEAPAFRGREPDEERWGIETPTLDSWRVRASWRPSPHCAAQASPGRPETPDATTGPEEQRRTPT